VAGWGVLRGAPRLGAVRVLAIDGPSGSGKSVLARRVVGELRAAGVRAGLVATDDFATWDEPVAWWPRLVSGVLVPLADGRAGEYRAVEWVNGMPAPGSRIVVEVPEVLVLEGVSSGRRSVRALLNRLVWVEHPDPVMRLERAVSRDGEPCREPLRAWQRFENGWFAVDGTRAVADVRLTNGYSS
jgi:ABC-type dipeptide/oligopeptide/nickel transport system ATPase component